MYVHIYSQIWTCMYDFRADHLTLDNHLVCSSLGETPLWPSCPQLPVVLLWGLSHVGFAPSSLPCPLMLSLFTAHLSSHVEETLRVSLLMLPDELPDPWSSGFSSFCRVFCNAPWTSGAGDILYMYPLKPQVLETFCTMYPLKLGPTVCILTGCGFL